MSDPTTADWLAAFAQLDRMPLVDWTTAPAMCTVTSNPIERNEMAFYPLRVPIPCPACGARITEVTRDTFVATSMRDPECGHTWVAPASHE